MPNIALSEARVKALLPRPFTYDIRDAKLRGFGVRVLPSGAKRFFIHAQHRGMRIWKMVGDASTMNVGEARSRAASLLAAIRCDADAPASPDAARFEAVAETVFQRYARVWKPQTLYVNRNYLRRQILPWFGGTQIADITRADVQRWFASRRATLVAADRSMPILSVILKEAERMGYRPEGSNPCRGIRRYRRKGRERYLSDAEIGRLAAMLSVHEGERPLQVAAVRLLLLTGCRKSEVLTLRWSDYREGRLFLRDGKTGPRTVWLSRAACNVLDCIERLSPRLGIVVLVVAVHDDHFRPVRGGFENHRRGALDGVRRIARDDGHVRPSARRAKRRPRRVRLVRPVSCLVGPPLDVKVAHQVDAECSKASRARHSASEPHGLVEFRGVHVGKTLTRPSPAACATIRPGRLSEQHGHAKSRAEISASATRA